jgi:hypothetical protein
MRSEVANQGAIAAGSPGAAPFVFKGAGFDFFFYLQGHDT